MSAQNAQVNGPQAYLRTKVMTASPAELRLMLFDGAIRFAEQARRGYTDKNYEMSFEGTTKAQAILMELMSSLRPDQAPELCQRLSALYTFMYSSLVQASTTRDVALVDEVIKLLRFERETWAMCIDELARENQNASGMRAMPSVDPRVAQPQGADGAPRSSLSLRG